MESTSQVLAHGQRIASPFIILIGHADHLKHLEPLLRQHLKKAAFIRREAEEGSEQIICKAREHAIEGFDMTCCSGFPPNIDAFKEMERAFDHLFVFSVETDAGAYGRQFHLGHSERARLAEAAHDHAMLMSGLIGYVGRTHSHMMRAVHHKRSINVQAEFIANTVLGRMSRRLIPAS